MREIKFRAWDKEEHDDGTYSYYALSDDATLEEMQVIGNIYEHPDLLKHDEGGRG